MDSVKDFSKKGKIPVLPPLFHNNKCVTDFKEKAELFNSFFPKQCLLIKNDSKLPSQLHFLTAKRLSMVKSANTDILKIISILTQIEPMVIRSAFGCKKYAETHYVGL